MEKKANFYIWFDALISTYRTETEITRNTNAARRIIPELGFCLSPSSWPASALKDTLFSRRFVVT